MNNDFPSKVLISGRVRVCLDLLKTQDLRQKTVVDIGCSFGWLEKILLESNPKKIIGVDPEKKAISFARKNVKNATFFEGTVLDIPLSGSFCDLVCLFDVIEHVPKEEEIKALGEVNRILKKGGHIVFSTPNSHPFYNFLDPAWYLGHRHYKINKIAGLLKKTGFKIISLKVRGGFWSYIYLIWLYVAKRITNTYIPRNRLLESLDDKDFDNQSIHTIYLVARKFQDFKV